VSDRLQPTYRKEGPAPPTVRRGSPKRRSKGPQNATNKRNNSKVREFIDYFVVHKILHDGEDWATDGY
jgi:hypothetical protein